MVAVREPVAPCSSPHSTPPSFPLRVCGACASEKGRVHGRDSWNERRMAVGGALRERALLTGCRQPIGCVHTRTRSVRPASTEPAATFLRSGHNTHTHTHTTSVDHVFFWILMHHAVVYLALLSGSLRIVLLGEKLLRRAVGHIRTVSGPSPGPSWHCCPLLSRTHGVTESLHGLWQHCTCQCLKAAGSC